MNKSFAAATFLAVAALAARGQNLPEPQAGTPADNGNLPATLIQPIERAADYLNFYAFADGIYDATNAQFGVYRGANGASYDAGGGVSAGHDFSTGTFSFSYRGDYRSYSNGENVSGTDQNLTFFYRKILNRRWTISFNELGGIYPEGTIVPQPSPVTESNFLQTSPFSLNLKFSGTTFATSYKVTNRLSYEFTGTFDLIRYNSPISYGDDDGIGTASVLYRLTRATTLSGTYQFSDFVFQHNAGEAVVHSAYGTVSHHFANRWEVGASGGASYTHDSGTMTIPYNFQIGGVTVPVYLTGRYNEHAALPYFQGTATKHMLHSLVSVSGGESVTPGNGFFLASRTIGINGVFSYSLPRMNFSGGGYWSRLTSIANSAGGYNVQTVDLDLSYSYNLIRHLGLNARYDHIGYNTIGAGAGYIDNRMSVGFFFSSKDVPLAIF